MVWRASPARPVSARSARRELQAAAAEGEPRAAAIWQQAVTACAAGVSNLVMSFSPNTVVIGGGLGRQEEFFTALRQSVLGRPGRHPEDLRIVRSALGDDAGLSGAAGWEAATRLA